MQIKVLGHPQILKVVGEYVRVEPNRRHQNFEGKKYEDEVL